jgi:YidC/Oxa1 family membrane protein insertase
MQQKRLILFFVVSLLILVGWSYIHQLIVGPAPKKVTPVPELKLPDPRTWAGVPAAIQACVEQPVPVPGLGNAALLATEIAIRANVTAERPPLPVVRKPEEKPKPVVAQKPSETIPIGNDQFYLQGRLTTHGAGVLDLVLPGFEQADWYGRPAGRKLELIPEDRRPKNVRMPSFLLYHYKNGGESHPDHPEADLGELEWTVQTKENGADDQVHKVVFTAEVPEQQVTITKTYTLEKKDYHIGLAIRLERHGGAAEPLKVRYQLTGAHGMPIEGVWYTTVYRNALVGLVDNKSGAFEERDLQTSREIGFKDGGHEVTRQDQFIRYAGVVTQFFASMIVVDDKQDKGVDQKRLLAWARPTREGEPDPTKQFLDDITVRVISQPVELAAGASVVHKYLLYNGPVKVRLLQSLEENKQVSPELLERYENKLHLASMTDYGSYGLWTTLLVKCTNVMHWLLWKLHSLNLWSYGVCIILLTVVVRGFMFPLSRKQAMSTARMQEKMQKLNKELAPEIKKLEEKLKDDAWKLRQAKHELYMKHGVNPAAMLSSCWLMFAQLPIFLGLYYALQESINFRLQSFLWIQNLSAPDMLIWWGEKIPFVSDPHNLGGMFYLGPYFNLLPIIWVVLMLIQQKIMTPPAADEQQAMQQKMMRWMTLLFLAFFYKVPAGLCIYWIGSILWSLTERKLIPKPSVAGAAPSAPAQGKGTGGGPSARGKARPAKTAKEDGNGTIRKVSDWWAEVLKQAKKK